MGIDIRGLQEDDRFRGIGTYLSNLIQAISRIDEQNEYLPYAWDDNDPLTARGFPPRFKFRLILLRRHPRTSRSEGSETAF